MNSHKMFARKITAATLLLAMTGCAATPMGPNVMVLPQSGKPFDQFQNDQAVCKQFADQQTAGQADRANTIGLLEGVGGTILGAGLGAAIGGGRGAAIGAAGGALGGTAVGASTSGGKQGSIQRQYDNAYSQCMVAKGNQIQQPVVYTPPAPTLIYQAPPTVVYTQPQPTVIYAQPAPPPPPPPMGYAPY